MYPLFNFAVDTVTNGSSNGNDGMGSSLAPNMMLAMNVLRNGQDTTTTSSMASYLVKALNPSGVVGMVGSIVGGLVGGKWMQHYFPDN